MDLTTLARIKTLLAIDTAETQHDALLSQLISAVSAEAEVFLDRHAQQVARVEQYDVYNRQAVFFLRGYPVLVAPAPTVNHNLDRDFSGADLSVDAYYLELATGKLTVDRVELTPGPGVLEVSYTGGMAASTAALVTAFPAVAHAVDIQVAFVFQRRHSLGISGFSAEGGSVSLETPVELIPIVKSSLKRFRRKETS